MTPQQFCFWLRGYLDAQDQTYISAQLKLITQKLKEVCNSDALPLQIVNDYQDIVDKYKDAAEATNAAAKSR